MSSNDTARKRCHPNLGHEWGMTTAFEPYAIGMARSVGPKSKLIGQNSEGTKPRREALPSSEHTLPWK